MKDVLDLLISLSLVQSTAYPALVALDSNLHSLIFEPQQSLGRLALFDQQAAKMLQTHLSGYATLRRFYDLRDEEVRLEEGQKPNLRPIARMNAAATALLAVINSAADNIHGGLYDENRGAVVQVDALLALLGEATMFVNRKSSCHTCYFSNLTMSPAEPSFLLSQPQCFSLIKAIEDLQTTAPRIYSQCEECFHATLVACKGRAAPPSPRQLLQKTMSSMSASSFSLLGESMSHSESSGLGSSRALAKSQEEEKRGWDWRRGLAENAKGEDMLRILRLGLAKDIAKHWISG